MKRKTKAQREHEAKAALLQRVEDIYAGALGMECDDDQWATADILSRVVPALREIFSSDSNAYLFEVHCLQYFDTAKSAAQHLYGCGIRA